MRPERGVVLYWMVASRRTRWNFALERAVELARELGRGLVILEALSCEYRYASDRLHAFVLEGMAANARRLARRLVTYFPYVEPARGAGRGLLASLARHACAVVTDDSPAFFLPRLVAAGAAAVDVRMEAVDSCGLMPLSLCPKPYSRAVDFRRHVQRHIAAELGRFPAADPLTGARLPPPPELPEAVLARWPPAPVDALGRGLLPGLPIDHSVPPVATVGGSTEGERRLRRFIEQSLPTYDTEQMHPDTGCTSGLSPYLHFGHVSAHQVFREVAASEDWTPDRLEEDVTPRGKREGFWLMSSAAEAFLDQLVTWRELGHVFCRHVPDADRPDTLPGWALETLAAHESDPRPHRYDAVQLAGARTGDPVWNAAQRQLLEEGVIHNYLRMLWGKKILEWTPDAATALSIMFELNDRFAIDGRDPNSVSGITWVLGRFDRAWPEAPVFGKVRRMTSASARRKLRMSRYLERYGDPPGAAPAK